MPTKEKKIAGDNTIVSIVGPAFPFACFHMSLLRPARFSVTSEHQPGEGFAKRYKNRQRKIQTLTFGASHGESALGTGALKHLPIHHHRCVVFLRP